MAVGQRTQQPTSAEPAQQLDAFVLHPSTGRPSDLSLPPTEPIDITWRIASTAASTSDPNADFRPHRPATLL